MELNPKGRRSRAPANIVVGSGTTLGTIEGVRFGSDVVVPYWKLMSVKSDVFKLVGNPVPKSVKVIDV